MKRMKKAIAWLLIVAIAFQIFQQTTTQSLAENSNEKEYSVNFYISGDGNAKIPVSGECVTATIGEKKVCNDKVKLDPNANTYTCEISGDYFDGSKEIDMTSSNMVSQNEISIDLTSLIKKPVITNEKIIGEGKCIKVSLNPDWTKMKGISWQLTSEDKSIVSVASGDSKEILANMSGTTHITMACNEISKLNVTQTIKVSKPYTVTFTYMGETISAEGASMKVSEKGSSETISSSGDGIYEFVSGDSYECVSNITKKVEFTPASGDSINVPCELKVEKDVDTKFLKTKSEMNLPTTWKEGLVDIKWSWNITDASGNAISNNDSVSVKDNKFMAKESGEYTLEHIGTFENKTISGEKIKVSVFDNYSFSPNFAGITLSSKRGITYTITKDEESCAIEDMEPEQTYKVKAESPYSEPKVTEIHTSSTDPEVEIFLGRLNVVPVTSGDAITKEYDATSTISYDASLALAKQGSDDLYKELSKIVSGESVCKVSGELDGSDVYVYFSTKNLVFCNDRLNRKYYFNKSISGEFYIQRADLSLLIDSVELFWRSHKLKNVSWDEQTSIRQYSDTFKEEMIDLMKEKFSYTVSGDHINIPVKEEKLYSINNNNIRLTFNQSTVEYEYTAEVLTEEECKEALSSVQWFQKNDNKSNPLNAKQLVCVTKSGSLVASFEEASGDAFNMEKKKASGEAGIAYDQISINDNLEYSIPDCVEEVETDKVFLIYAQKKNGQDWTKTIIGALQFYTGEKPTAKSYNLNQLDGDNDKGQNSRMVPMVYVKIVDAPDGSYTLDDTKTNAYKLADVSEGTNLQRKYWVNNTNKDQKKYMAQFSLEESGESVNDMEYCIYDVTQISNPTVAQVKEYTTTISQWKEGSEIDLSQLGEGDYVIINKIEFNNNEVYYCSDMITIDTTNPSISESFTDGEDKVNVAYDESKRTFSGKKITGTFTIKDANIDYTKSVDIKVTAVDADGKAVETAYFEQQIQDAKAAFEGTDSSKKDPAITLQFDRDANYTVTITAYDKAGNESISKETKKTYTCYFTVDTTKPEGSITVLNSKWKNFLSKITFGLYSQSSTTAELKANDATTNYKVYYMVTKESFSAAEIEKLDNTAWTKWEVKDGAISLPNNQQHVVYEKIVDEGGNVFYVSTNGMIFDNVKPTISVEENNEANENGLYNEDIYVAIKVEDPKATDGSCSLLKKVSYYIETPETKSEVVTKENVDKDSYSINSLKIDAATFNSNRVVLHIEAEDYAGNSYIYEKKYMIDVTKPELMVSYNQTVENNYYSGTRTATLSVKERNFSKENALITISSEHGAKVVPGKWTNLSASGKSDNTTYTCQITFDSDDDYILDVVVEDEADNSGTQKIHEEFTIDQTAPKISVSYNGEQPADGDYVNQEVTTTITIEEHNFEASKVEIPIEAVAGGTVPVVSDFTTKGDTHTATIHYGADGRYEFSVAYEDKAGNQAVSYESPSFTVDLTSPELEIAGVDNNSANKDEVKPFVTCSDKNFDAKLVSVTVENANSGEMDLTKLSYKAVNVENGQQFTMNFPKTEGMDGLYTLSAKIADKAGNEAEKKVTFSVNRFGSVYVLDDATRAKIANGEYAYLKESTNIGIVEINADEIVKREISYTTGGVNGIVVNVPSKKESTTEDGERYYKITKLSTSEDGWIEYRYDINEANFDEEGQYNVVISSQDKAGNKSSNLSNRHENSQISIAFAVDKTAPRVSVSDCEEGAVYNENVHEVQLNAQDNLALENVTVYVNGVEYGSYSQEEIETFENDVIPIEIEQSVEMQTIRMTAVDKAGNELVDKKSNGANKYKEVNFLVTTNAFVRLVHNTWAIVVVCAAAAVAVASVVGFIVYRRRKYGAEIEE